MDGNERNYRCLLCLFNISEEVFLNKKNKTGINVVKLCQLIQHRSLRNLTNHQNIVQNEEICNIRFCAECIFIIDETCEIHEEIVQLESKLRTQIELIRNKILESNNQDNFKSDDDKLDKLRRSLLRLSSVDEDDKIDEPTVKMEQEENEDSFDNDDFDQMIDDPLGDVDQENPCSPSELFIFPSNPESCFKEEIEEEEEDIDYMENEDDDDEEDNDWSPVSRKNDTSNQSRRITRGGAFTVVKNEKTKKSAKSVEGQGRRNRAKRKYYPCSFCPRRMENKKAYDAHMYMNHEDKNNQPLSCSNCDKKFTLQVNLERHLALHEVEDKKPFVCVVCDYRLESKSLLEVHTRKHDTHVNCQVCDKRISRTTVNGHMKRHAAKSFKCDYCDDYFVHLSTKSAHMSKEHPSVEGQDRIVKKKAKRKFYPCSLCPRKMENKKAYDAHMYMEHEDKNNQPLSCSKDKCGKKFTLQVNLERHLALHEVEDDKPFVCVVCDYRLESKSLLEEHVAKHDTHVNCQLCGQKMHKSSLWWHMKRHGTDAGKSDSGDEVSTKTAHMSKDHPLVEDEAQDRIVKKKVQRKFYPCSLCPRKMENKKAYDAHMYMKHEDKNNQPLSCFKDKCGKKFTLQVNLERHLALHEVEDDKPFVCQVCDYRLESKTRFEEHVAKHDTRVKTVNCQVCGLRMRKDSLLAHMKRHDRPKEQLPVNHPCLICLKTFPTKIKLAGHMKNHIKHTCNECKENFLTRTALKSHKIRKHGAEPWICDIPECGGKFTTMGGLKIHKFVHTGEKPFQCELCGAKFSHKQKFRIHMDTHSDDRPHPCPHCEKRYKSRRDLGKHLKSIHSKKDVVTPARHLCNYCGKGFASGLKWALDAHIRQVHTGERPFVCSVCNKGFAIKTNLTLHMKSHGIIKESTVQKLPRSKRDEFLPPSHISTSSNQNQSDATTSPKKKLCQKESSEEDNSNSIHSIESEFRENNVNTSTNNNINNTFPVLPSSFYNPLLSQYYQI